MDAEPSQKHLFYLFYLLSMNHVFTNLWTADLKNKKKRFKYPSLHTAMALSPNDRPSWSYRPFSMSPSALHFFSERINEKIWKCGVQWINKRDILETDKQMYLTLAFHVQGFPFSVHTLWCSTSCEWFVTRGTYIQHYFSMIELYSLEMFSVQLLVRIFGWFATSRGNKSLRHWNRQFQSTAQQQK